MKVMSLTQPYATLIACGAKRIETRSWPAPRAVIGARIAIHASKAFPPEDREYAMTSKPIRRALIAAVKGGYVAGVNITDLPRGGVVALATLQGCYAMNDAGYRQIAHLLTSDERAFGSYGDGRYAWVFSNVRAIEPIPARGSLGLWDWEPPDWLTYLDDEALAQRGSANLEAHRQWTEREERMAAAKTAAKTAATATIKPGATRVVHCRKDAFDTYIGRPMPRYPELTSAGWGNPYRDGLDTPDGRKSAIDRYREWLMGQPQLLARLPELRGKTLGCWCAPKGGLPGDLHGRVCHGEVLAALADGVAIDTTPVAPMEPEKPEKPHDWQVWDSKYRRCWICGAVERIPAVQVESEAAR